MIRMKSMLVQCQIFAVILGCLTFSSLHAEEQWKFSVNQYDLRETYIDQQAVVLGVPCNSRLKFICTQDQKGATGCLSMEFTIAPYSKIAGFDFEFFEGPDAPVGGKKLMSITLAKDGKQTRIQESPGGWVSAEIEDGFVFGYATPTKNRNGYMRKVINQIIGGAETIEVAVTDGKNPSKVVSVIFPVVNGRESFKSLLKGIK
jgi:hypothetical protein